MEETTSPCQKKKKEKGKTRSDLSKESRVKMCARIYARVCVSTCDKSSPGLLLGFRAIGFRPKEIRISGKQERERERERQPCSNSPLVKSPLDIFDRSADHFLRKWNDFARWPCEELDGIQRDTQWITKEKRRRRRVGGWTYARRSTFETRPCAPFSEISILSADRATREVYEFKKKRGKKRSGEIR